MYDELVDLAKSGGGVCVGAWVLEPTPFVDALHVGVIFGPSSSSGEGIGLHLASLLDL